jgi:hypothetical protein
MPRFLLEVPHEEEKIACARAIQLLFKSGSHFVTHADFGCMDGDHRAWIVVEADSKEEARSAIPAAYRARSKVTGLNKFRVEEIDELLAAHGG